MLEGFAVIGLQVLILYVLIGVGFFLSKKNMLNKEGISCLNDIMLYIVAPCVVIDAFQREFDATLFRNLLLSMLGAVISHVINGIVAMLIIRNKSEAKQRVLRFATVFSNCGFMALPLLDALLGSEGVFYGAGYLAVFNIIVWSIGQYGMAKGSEGFDRKRIILNPTVISCVIGLAFFFTSTTLPPILAAPISYLSYLNTPVPMLIIGYTISTISFKEILGIKDEALAIISRLVVCPSILLIVLYFMGIRGVLLVATMVSATTPVAAITTMFSIKFNQDTPTAAKMVAISSLFSVFTMTVIVGITQGIAF